MVAQAVQGAVRATRAGIEKMDFSLSFSCALFGRKNPLSKI
jgi:hypothetical protein